MYHPLSSLINKKSIRKLYEIMYDNIITIKLNAPKITLTLINEKKMIGKATMMENEPLPDVVITFQEMQVSSMRYRMSTGVITIHHSDTDIDDVTIPIETVLSSSIITNSDDDAIDSNDEDEIYQEIVSDDEKNMIKYQYYTYIALAVVKECMNIEHRYEKESSSPLSPSILFDNDFIYSD